MAFFVRKAIDSFSLQIQDIPVTCCAATVPSWYLIGFDSACSISHSKYSILPMYRVEKDAVVIKDEVWLGAYRSAERNIDWTKL